MLPKLKSKDWLDFLKRQYEQTFLSTTNTKIMSQSIIDRQKPQKCERISEAYAGMFETN